MTPTTEQPASATATASTTTATASTMTELEKLKAGLEYSFGDAELAALKDTASTRCARVNATLPGTPEHLSAVQELLGTEQDDVDIEPGFQCDNGRNIHVGERFVANYGVKILDVAEVTIGDFVMIGPNTLISTVGHPLSPLKRRDKAAYAHPVTIGDDVWIGGNVAIMPGVTIGSNVVVGAGAVVTKDVPANSLVLGVPARVVKTLEDDVER